MKLVDKIASRQGQPFYTFEFFPPRTDQVRLNVVSCNWSASLTTSSPRALITFSRVYRD
jgi:5,10-methylenetetrahydrofolate reductase